MAQPSTPDTKRSTGWKGIAGLIGSQVVVNGPWLVNQVQAVKAGSPVKPPEGWELVLTCVGLVGAFALKVWKELEKDALKGVAAMLKAAPRAASDLLGRSWDALAGTIGRWVTFGSFKRRYLAELRYKHGLFNDKGLGLINADRLDLE